MSHQEGSTPATPPATGSLWRRLSAYPRERWYRWARRVAAWLTLAVLSLFSGIAATSLFPAVVSTPTYEATVRLSLQPRRIGDLHASTLFGDLLLTFTTWVPAPGLDVVPQLRSSITDVFASGQTSMTALRPTTAQLDAAIRDAVWQVGLRFTLGVAVVLGLALLVIRLRRGRIGLRSWLQALVLPVSASLACLLGTGGAMAYVYQPGRVGGISTTGLISLAMTDARALSTVQARAAEVTPYVRSLLALSTALQERYAGGALQTNTPVKILLVSDIHGADQYPLMKAIVEAEDITAVIDAGDIVNFGRVEELRAGSDLLAGIRSLGVPYLFVRGNHDAAAPDDEQILKAIATVPNAVVLQPTSGRYTIADVAGLRIAGFNDPRWFGDGGKDAAAAQVPATRSFQRLLDEFAGRSGVVAAGSASATTSSPAALPAATAAHSAAAASTTAAETPHATTPARSDPIDIVVGHEPSAVEPISGARLRVNGHLHSATLGSNRIGIGTFTGGGVASRYIAEEDGELQGQPYTFDILSYATDCSLASLTRYEFRNLVEGRPVYDGVQVINGSTVQSPVPQPGRLCLPDLPEQRLPVILDDPFALPTTTP